MIFVQAPCKVCMNYDGPCRMKNKQSKFFKLIVHPGNEEDYMVYMCVMNMAYLNASVLLIA